MDWDTSKNQLGEERWDADDGAKWFVIVRKPFGFVVWSGNIACERIEEKKIGHFKTLPKAKAACQMRKSEVA